MFSSMRIRSGQSWLRHWLAPPRPFRHPRSIRPLLECLESRLAPAAVSWDGGAGTSNWHDALNWSGDVLPGAADDVTIDVPAVLTIIHSASAGATTINSLTTAEALNITGGSLNVTNDLLIRNTLSLAGGTLRNASVTTDNAAIMQATSADGTLDGVTLGVNTTLQEGAQVTVLNNLALADNVTLRLEHPTSFSNSATLDVGLNLAGGAQTLSGSGVVELHNAYDQADERYVRVRSTGAGSSLTIGAGITVQNSTTSKFTALGEASVGLTIQGTVKAQSSGQTLAVRGSTVTNSGMGTLQATAGTLQVSPITFTNNGTVKASGGTVLVQPTTLTNLAAGTLTGGIWEAHANSSIYLPGQVTTNAASILLNGSNSNIYMGTSGTSNALSGLATNTAAGSFTISGGRNFAVPLDFTSAGNVTVGVGSTFGYATAAPPTTSGLVSHWKADGGASDSVNANHGTLTNGATAGNPGVLGQTFTFDGVNDHVAINDATNLRPANLTVAAWVNLAALPTGSNVFAIVAKAVGTGIENSYLLWYSGGALRAYISNHASGAPDVGHAWNPGLGIWHHVAFSFDDPSNTLRLYINGVLVASNTGATRSIFYDAKPVLIGADTTSGALSHLFNGRIDEVRFYNRALSATEVQAIQAFETGQRDFAHTGGTVTIAGTVHVLDFTGSAGATLAFNLNSPYTTAGTDYGQLVVNGAVDLGGANLSLLGGAVIPARRSVMTLINNDAGGAVSGPFNGLAENALVTAGNFSGVVRYAGGTGNDVVLVTTGLSAADNGGDWTIADRYTTGEANQLTITRVGDDLHITDSVEMFGAIPAGAAVSADRQTLIIPLAALTSLTINGGGGEDTLIVDLAGGNLIPAGGLFFNGGDPTTGTGDSLVILGGDQGTVTYDYTNASDGSVTMSNFGTIHYTGLEPITNTGTATDIIFNLPVGTNHATLGDDGVAAWRSIRRSPTASTMSHPC